MSDTGSSGGVGTGIGVVGLGCVLLLGAAGLAGFLLCGGVGRSVWSSLPDVVDARPVRPVPGTPPAPEPARPVRPNRPSPTGPRPARPSEPTSFDVNAESLIVAEVALVGDAVAALAIGADGTAFPLPGGLARGTYALQVTFAGRDPFEAGTLTVLDGSPRTVTCRAALGLCKIQ